MIDVFVFDRAFLKRPLEFLKRSLERFGVVFAPRSDLFFPVKKLETSRKFFTPSGRADNLDAVEIYSTLCRESI
ncbi:MAG: hypothetical protein ACI9HK_005289 [Pirellulaceae bacterium]